MLIGSLRSNHPTAAITTGTKVQPLHATALIHELAPTSNTQVAPWVTLVLLLVGCRFRADCAQMVRFVRNTEEILKDLQAEEDFTTPAWQECLEVIKPGHAPYCLWAVWGCILQLQPAVTHSSSPNRG
jgi:hypothetical protein